MTSRGMTRTPISDSRRTTARAGGEGGRPGYLDYGYLALTNMMAFSPTDVMPMTVRAKLLMGYQALTGFVLLALVISRAVTILT
jgi:hypothetical protein